MQHIRHGIPFVGELNLNAAVREDEYVHRFGIAEQVVHIPEDLLIGANHKEAQHRRIFRIVFRHRHGGGNPVAIHIVVNRAIGIAGDIQQHRAAFRHHVQPFQRHHREQLIDTPCIRHRLEQREVDVNLIRHPFLQFVDNRSMRTVARVELFLYFMAHVQIQLFCPGALLKIEGTGRVADMNIVEIHLAVVQPFAQRAAVAGLVHLLPGFPHTLQRTRRVLRRRGRFGVFVTFNADDVGDQHGVVSGHRAPGFGNHRRVRQAVLFTGIANRPDNVVSILVQAVVHRTVRL